MLQQVKQSCIFVWLCSVAADCSCSAVVSLWERGGRDAGDGGWAWRGRQILVTDESRVQVLMCLELTAASRLLACTTAPLHSPLGEVEDVNCSIWNEVEKEFFCEGMNTGDCFCHGETGRCALKNTSDKIWLIIQKCQTLTELFLFFVFISLQI